MDRTRTLISALTIVLLSLILGCVEEPEEVVTETAATDTSPTATAEQEVPGLPDGSEPVQVVLSSYKIDMPATLPEGMTLFTVNNEGDEEHSFEIEGQGIEKALEANLQPGEVTTIEVDLMPGEYRVYCPVGDHASRGMEMTLTVTESSAEQPMGSEETTTGTEETTTGTEI